MRRRKICKKSRGLREEDLIIEGEVSNEEKKVKAEVQKKRFICRDKEELLFIRSSRRAAKNYQ